MVITNEFLSSLLGIADQVGAEVEEYEGVLNDSYIIHAAKQIRIKGMRRSKYIIVEAFYINEWSSGLYLSVTNDEQKVEQLIEAWRQPETSNLTM